MIAALGRRDFLAITAGSALGLAFGCDSNSGGSTLPDGGPLLGPDAGPVKRDFPQSILVQRGYAPTACSFVPDIDIVAGKIHVACTPSPLDATPTQGVDAYDPSQTSPLAANPIARFLNAPETRRISSIAPTKGSRGVAVANDGLYDFDRTTGTSLFVPFTNGNNTGGGSVVAGNKLFVAAANLEYPVYREGRIVIHEMEEDGRVVPTSVGAITTQNLNPTGLALLEGAQRLLVLCSGDFSANSQAALEVYDPNDGTLLNQIDLGYGPASLTPEIALTEDERFAFVGSAQGDRLVRVDLRNNLLETISLAGTSFHSSVITQGGLVAVSDFGSSLVTILAAGTLSKQIQAALAASDNAGPAVFLANNFIVQTVVGGLVGLSLS